MGTPIRAPRVAKRGTPPSPVTSRTGGGASVVVGARESRAQGEGRQFVGARRKPQGKAMYVATASDRRWLLNTQRALHQRSRTNPDYVFRKLWGLVTDRRNLHVAVARVAGNRGKRTP